ncbi:hypothetical protein N0V90_002689 [Kalmusia sp. IMI 367209]|nr:hypothetical protein N0V90_002689 [Kalmusia sp. IMI 367209]
MDSAQPFRLMDLPLEIRLMVYERVPITTKIYGVSKGSHNQFGTQSLQYIQSQGGLVVFDKIIPTCILLVSRKVHDEAVAIMKGKLNEVYSQPLQLLLYMGRRRATDGIDEAVIQASHCPAYSDQLCTSMLRFARKIRDSRQLNVHGSQRVAIDIGCTIATKIHRPDRERACEELCALLGGISVLVSRKLLFTVRLVRSWTQTFTVQEEQELERSLFCAAESWPLSWSNMLKGHAIELDDWMEDWTEGSHFREHGSAVAVIQGYRGRVHLYQDTTENLWGDIGEVLLWYTSSTMDK